MYIKPNMKIYSSVISTRTFDFGKYTKITLRNHSEGKTKKKICLLFRNDTRKTTSRLSIHPNENRWKRLWRRAFPTSRVRFSLQLESLWLILRIEKSPSTFLEAYQWYNEMICWVRLHARNNIKPFKSERDPYLCYRMCTLSGRFASMHGKNGKANRRTVYSDDTVIYLKIFFMFYFVDDFFHRVWVIFNWNSSLFYGCLCGNWIMQYFSIYIS